MTMPINGDVVTDNRLLDCGLSAAETESIWPAASATHENHDKNRQMQKQNINIKMECDNILCIRIFARAFDVMEMSPNQSRRWKERWWWRKRILPNSKNYLKKLFNSNNILAFSLFHFKPANSMRNECYVFIFGDLKKEDKRRETKYRFCFWYKFIQISPPNEHLIEATKCLLETESGKNRSRPKFGYFINRERHRWPLM